MNSSSARLKTLPVGLFGVLRMMALVRGPKARGKFSGSNVQSGGAKFHETRRRAGEDRIRPVIFVERLEDDDFVAGIDDGHHARTSSLRWSRSKR